MKPTIYSFQKKADIKTMQGDRSTQVIAILLAAGRGSRFGSGHNKVFQTIGGTTVLERAARCLLDHPRINSLIVVGAAGEEERIGALLASAFTGRKIRIVKGGDSRQESALAGLLAASQLEDNQGKGRTLALIHDAARCFLSQATITDLIDTISRYHCGAAPAIAVTDTIRLLDQAGGSVIRTLPRERLAAMQTPQGADLDILLSAARLALGEAVGVTDDLELLMRIGYPVRLIPGDPLNIKITSPQDLFFAENFCLSEKDRQA